MVGMAGLTRFPGPDKHFGSLGFGPHRGSSPREYVYAMDNMTQGEWNKNLEPALSGLLHEEVRVHMQRVDACAPSTMSARSCISVRSHPRTVPCPAGDTHVPSVRVRVLGESRAARAMEPGPCICTSLTRSRPLSRTSTPPTRPVEASRCLASGL